MVYTDRLKTPIYLSPSGRSFTFDWEETEESFDHKASVFRFPKVDGAHVASLGTGESRFPLEMFIAGADYDIEADEVMDILKEQGNGTGSM